MEFQIDTGFFQQQNGFTSIDESIVHDVLIIGGGPAAMTAAVYCMRKGLRCGIIARQTGGQMRDTHSIENYMGYNYIEGHELVQRFREQVAQFSIGFREGATVTGLAADQSGHAVLLEDGTRYRARALIIATGSSWRRLGVPGERELTGMGVAYCSTCDAPLFRERDVVVVGGGNSGIEAALDLLRLARFVTVVEYAGRLKADDVLLQKFEAYENKKVILNSQITEIKGNGHVEQLVVRNRVNAEETVLKAEGVFIEIGLEPNSGFCHEYIQCNKGGEIVIDEQCRTSTPGVFAAGDVSTVPYKQIIIAAGEGAKAGLAAWQYIMNTKTEE